MAVADESATPVIRVSGSAFTGSLRSHPYTSCVSASDFFGGWVSAAKTVLAVSMALGPRATGSIPLRCQD